MSDHTELAPLEKEIAGEIFFDLPRRLLYQTSASSNAVLPKAVARPKNTQDLAILVEFCAKRGIPLTARGAGTGMSGSNLGPGVVIDFSRYFRSMIDLDTKAGRVRVQPGVTYGDLNSALATHGLFLPPDPSSGAYCTVGGMVANNAAGAHTVKYGSTREFVQELEIVDAQAKIERVSARKNSNGESSRWDSVQRLLSQNREQIEKGFPAVSKNSSGYLLQGVFQDGNLDPAKLLAGSEGTLAFFTEITFRVLPLPARRGLLLASFDSLENAGAAVIAVRALNPSALEILDRTVIQAILQNSLSVVSALRENSEAALLIEWEASEESAIDRGLKEVREALRPYTDQIVLAKDSIEQAKLWNLRRAAAVKVRRNDWKKPIRVIEDVAVPLAHVVDYIRGVRQILQRENTEAILIGHAGNGNIHVEPLLDVRAPDLKEKISRLAEQVSDLVVSLGGTLSGEHGDGIVRSPYLPKIFPSLIPVFEELKQIFDPSELLNPGVILPGKKKRSLLEELRYGKATIKTGTDFDDLHQEIEKCFSCGYCRSYCPSYLSSNREETLPRARAALLRGMIFGEISSTELFQSPETRKVFDSCIRCGKCSSDCPAGFDSAKLSKLSEKYTISLRA